MFCYGIPLGFDVSKLGLNQVGMWGPWENRPEVTNCLMSKAVLPLQEVMWWQEERTPQVGMKKP